MGPKTKKGAAKNKKTCDRCCRILTLIGELTLVNFANDAKKNFGNRFFFDK